MYAVVVHLVRVRACMRACVYVCACLCVCVCVCVHAYVIPPTHPQIHTSLPASTNKAGESSPSPERVQPGPVPMRRCSGRPVQKTCPKWRNTSRSEGQL